MATISGPERTMVLTSMKGATACALFFSDGAGTYLSRGPLRRPVRLAAERLRLPREKPDSLLVVPVGDLARHALTGLCLLAQRGYCLTDDVNGHSIPGMQRFRRLVDVDDPFPLTSFEQQMLAELAAQLACSCSAGVLTLRALGLRGGMLDGIDRLSLLGASGDAREPGLGFRFDDDERWSVPNPTGREGVFEAFCPPHHAHMRAAVDALRHVLDSRLRDCIALQAQYLFETFGKYPATVPSVMVVNYLEACPSCPTSTPEPSTSSTRNGATANRSYSRA